MRELPHFEQSRVADRLNFWAPWWHGAAWWALVVYSILLSSFRTPSSPFLSGFLQLDDEHFPWWLAEVGFGTA
jgi:hypothetical protein